MFIKLSRKADFQGIWPFSGRSEARACRANLQMNGLVWLLGKLSVGDETIRIVKTRELLANGCKYFDYPH